jgi:hypothetical protein
LVVEVLQAVHLLLAFPLFVVVVAVDARWVSRSLEHRFPGLLTADREASSSTADGSRNGNATPHDYLEKIFQIPFWLRQPTEDGVKRMLQDLMKESLQQTAPVTPPVTPTIIEPLPPPVPFKRRQHDPNAQALTVQPEEEAFIERLAPLLDRSPRALKRFVNVYRLLKASLPPEQQDAFLDDDGPPGAPYKIVLLLLAVVTGLPGLSNALLGALLSVPRATPGSGAVAASLGTVVDGLQMPQDDGRAQVTRLTTWLDKELGNEWRSTDATRLLAWVPQVARYSYHWHSGGK